MSAPVRAKPPEGLPILYVTVRTALTDAAENLTIAERGCRVDPILTGSLESKQVANALVAVNRAIATLEDRYKEVRNDDRH